MSLMILLPLSIACAFGLSLWLSVALCARGRGRLAMVLALLAAGIAVGWALIPGVQSVQAALFGIPAVVGFLMGPILTQRLSKV
jgi:peptidoglycan/LPS O-acetylase OafA/YrhL